MNCPLPSAEHIIAPGTTRKARVALLYSISADLGQRGLRHRAGHPGGGTSRGVPAPGRLNWIDYFDRIKLERTSLLGEPAAFGVLGVKVAFKPTTSKVIGRFKDNAPATVFHELGSGNAVYIGACPGLSYLKDAGFVPAELKEQYPPAQRRILTGLAAARGVTRLVELSEPVVEAGVYDAPAGTALVLANCTYGSPRKRIPGASAAGLQVAVFTTRLELNDVILLG